MTMIYDYKNRGFELVGANAQYTVLRNLKDKAMIKVANQHLKPPVWQIERINSNVQQTEN